jgi:NAD(P)-dependent dehydrogenase (short-subunit alcohol dehydrogenase family)
MSLTIDLTGRVVVVTGGAKGVGAGIVEMFLEAGAIVEICGRSEATGEPDKAARTPHYSRVDVREDDQVAAWISDVVERRGRLDVAVNNAGGSPFVPFAEGSARFQRKVLDLNFLSAAFVSHAVYPVMAAQTEGGVILNITSISARRPSPGTAVYGAAKAALESLTGSLAMEWAPAVRVNAISCGLVATEAAADHYGDAESYAAIAGTIPMGRLADPRDIGAACVMLASPLAKHITGAVLDVDGGGEWPAFLFHTPNASNDASTGGSRS